MKIKHHFKELFRVHNSPLSVALGFSVGALIGILPTPGIGILLGFLLLIAFPKLSKLGLIAAFAVFNPLVLAPLYVVSYRLGNFLLSDIPVTVVEVGAWQHTLRFLLGNVILAFLIALGSASILYVVLKTLQHRNKG